MIPRYSRSEMSAVWAPQNRLAIWFEIEAHAADALAEAGVIPKAAAATIWKKGRGPYDLEPRARSHAIGPSLGGRRRSARRSRCDPGGAVAARARGQSEGPHPPELR